MSGAWHGGKGSDPRPESEPGAYAKGFDSIDWNARSRENVERAEQAIQSQIKAAGDFAEVMLGKRKRKP